MEKEKAQLDWAGDFQEENREGTTVFVSKRADDVKTTVVRRS
jgi:hypothetical protein